MNDIAVRDLTPRPTAAVRVRAATAELGDLFDVHLPAIAERMADLGVEPAGPPYARYHEYGPERVDVEIGIPATRPIPNVPLIADVPAGELGNAELRGGATAVALHRGPYEGLHGTYERLEAWIREQGREVAPGPWESYVDDPGMVEDAAGIRTEVCWPLA